ncbi:MAG: magnesium transporter [bacterium]|nr:magnesium transporter [bacterium]
MAAGGNVGTQSLASMIRSIALGSLTIRQIPAIIGRETIVGLLLGLASGVLVGLVAQIWLGQWQLGLVIGLSMSVTLALASVMGTTIPLAFRWAGRDPAFASGPFITTLNDIISIFIYLILASLLITRF